jgi:3-oxoacyl-[acyl-carrier protein] reductase
MKLLNEKVVLVTGAGRGFGHGTARKLAEHGATVLATALELSELDELASTIRGSGGSIETFAVDLGDKAAVATMVEQILARHGRLDALVNNAAILRNTAFIDLSEADFEQTLDINLLAPARLIRAFLPSMLEQGRGAIINLSSGAGIRPSLLETDYCASKFGMEGFSYSLAMELAPKNISVNLVSPGYRIKPTSITAAEFATWPEERRAQFRDPIDMGDAFAYLCLQFPGEGGVTGKRFNAFELAETVRAKGWDWLPEN